MEIPLLPLIAILIMIGTLVVAYWRKLMMTYAIIIANFLVFLLSIFYPNEIIGDLGFRPAYLSIDQLPQLYTLFTSMFVHSGFLHILGNMFVFFFMGVAFEQRIGRKKFLVIYLITGVCGALTHSALNMNSWIPWLARPERSLEFSVRSPTRTRAMRSLCRFHWESCLSCVSRSFTQPSFSLSLRPLS